MTDEIKTLIVDDHPIFRRILQLIVEEKTSKEIGELLFIQPRTVDNHRTTSARN